MALNTPPDIVINATLGTVSGVPRSTASGMTGKLRFELAVLDAEELWPLVGEESFDLTFGDAELGDGYSISGLYIRPDADGVSRAFANFIAPETTAPALGLLFSRSLVGTSHVLRLIRNQTKISDQLTTPAPEVLHEPCPFPGCVMLIDHDGAHVIREVDADLLPN